jgi:ribose 5-phosphate isomerase B
MKIAIGSDHRGVRYKRMIKALLEGHGHQVEDCGSDSEESCDYPDYARSVARGVAQGDYERGILICGSGIGMSIAANRFRGVRATLCLSAGMAETARTHNDSNVLCLAQDLTDETRTRRIVETWLEARFEGGRHSRRLSKIDTD